MKFMKLRLSAIAACIAGLAASGVYAGADFILEDETGGGKAGAPQLDFNKIKVGDVVDVPLPEYSGRKLIPRKARIDQILHDHFIDVLAKHTVIYGVILDEDEHPSFQYHRFLRFQNGPVTDFYDITGNAVETCVHPKTGLVNLISIIHGGGTIDGEAGYVSFFGVNPQTHAIRTLYGEYAEHGPYNDKICVWPAKQERLSVFSEAMEALRIEDKDYKIDTDSGDDDKTVYASIGGLESGETMQLPWRAIPADVAQTWLDKLSDLAAHVVIDWEGDPTPEFVSITDERIGDWRLVQVAGMKLCSGGYTEGVTLAKHASWKDWRAIYNVESGCLKMLNYPLFWKGESGETSAAIENDILHADMIFEFTDWGYSREVALDLRTNVVTVK